MKREAISHLLLVSPLRVFVAATTFKSKNLPRVFCVLLAFEPATVGVVM